MALKKDSTVRLVADLNRPDPDAQGFAQTAIVLSERGMQMQPALDSLLRASCRFAVEQPDQAIRILEEKGIFAKGMLTESSIHRCRIDYVPACRAKEAVQNLLTIILAYEPKALGGKLPDDTFFYANTEEEHTFLAFHRHFMSGMGGAGDNGQQSGFGAGVAGVVCCLG